MGVAIILFAHSICFSSYKIISVIMHAVTSPILISSKQKTNPLLTITIFLLPFKAKLLKVFPILTSPFSLDLTSVSFASPQLFELLLLGYKEQWPICNSYLIWTISILFNAIDHFPSSGVFFKWLPGHLALFWISSYFRICLLLGVFAVCFRTCFLSLECPEAPVLDPLIFDLCHHFPRWCHQAT